MPENIYSSGNRQISGGYKPSDRFNSSGRIAFYIVASTTLMFLIALVIIATISLRAQWDSFYSYSSQLCLSSNTNSAHVIDGDMVENFAKNLRIDQEYEAFSARLDVLSKSVNAKYFYVLVDAGVPGMYTYIYDANHDQDYPGHKYALGDNESKDQYVGADAVLATGLGFQQAMYYNDPDQYGELYYAYSPIFNSKGEVVAFLGTDIDISPMKIKLHSFQRNLLLIAFFTILAFILIYYLVIKKIILDPLERVTDTALNLSRGKVELLPLTGLTSRNDEIGQLGMAFESVSGSIKRLINDIGRLMLAVRGGMLNMRVEPDSYEGDYRRIITGVNMTLDVMCKHFDAMEKGVCFFDNNGEDVLYCNQVAERYFRMHGLPEEGNSLLSSLLGAGQEQELSEIIQNSAQAPYYRTLNLTDTEEGAHRAYSLSLSLIHNELSGETAEADNSCLLAMITDITSIAQARIAADQANQAKTEFLSRVSHEMRTPMNAIIGMTYIAGSTDEKDKIRYCLDKIDTASKQLLTVIEDMLDMSRIETHQLKIFNKEFNLESILKNIASSTQYEAEKKKQNFFINLDNNIPASVISDSLRLSQVLTKLLTNAVKFTEENGTVTLNIENIGEENNIVNLQFEIIDNGIGISPEQLPCLFTFFEQGDGGIDRKYGGTGLGLVISKYIIELMGGQIRVDSELGQGTKFTFNIKVEKGANNVDLKLDPAINKGATRILAVDDAREIRDYFIDLMTSLGLPCDVAESGEQAMEMILSSKDENPYSICFIDWLMPGMNGIELAEKISGVSPESAIIIMISAASWNDIEEGASSAGIKHYIPKPLLPSTLVAYINKTLAGDHYALPDVAAKEDVNNTFHFQNRTVLLAEDKYVDRDIFLTILEPTGLSIDFAGNGRETVSMFQDKPERYDLILISIEMPGINGYEATRQIRALEHPAAAAIPIIALTPNMFWEDADKYFDVGVNDHISKPVDPRNLLLLFEKYLTKTNQEKLPERKNAPKVTVDNAIDGSQSNNDYSGLKEIIDVQGGLNRLMNNKKLYFMSLEKFTKNTTVNDISASIGEGDLPKVAQNARALKDIAANLGLTNLHEVASRVENHAKVEVNPANLLDSLVESVAVTKETINRLLESEE